MSSPIHPNAKHRYKQLARQHERVQPHDHEWYIDTISKMKDPKYGIPIKDRSLHFHVYQNCFVGQDFVQWCISNGVASSRARGELMGQDMIDRGLVYHVCNDLPFKDGYFFYYFYVTALSDTQCEELLAKMKSPTTGVPIEDRSHHLRTYKQCFIGSECVEWLLKNAPDLTPTREHAVKLGQELMNKGLINHSSNQHPFLDGSYFYFFQKAVYAGYLGKLSKSGLVWKMRWFALRDIKENRLWYYNSMREPVPKKDIPLVNSFLRVFQDNDVGYMELTTPSRIYKLRAASEFITSKWVKYLLIHTKPMHEDNDLIELADREIVECEYNTAAIDIDANASLFSSLDTSQYENANRRSIITDGGITLRFTPNTSSYANNVANGALGYASNTSYTNNEPNLEILMKQLNMPRLMSINGDDETMGQGEAHQTASGLRNNSLANETTNPSAVRAKGSGDPRNSWVDRAGVKNDIFIKNSV